MESPSSPPIPDVDTLPTLVDYHYLANDWFRRGRSECFRCVAVVRFEPIVLKNSKLREARIFRKRTISWNKLSPALLGSYEAPSGDPRCIVAAPSTVEFYRACGQFFYSSLRNFGVFQHYQPRADIKPTIKAMPCEPQFL
jgi:hypothetical protein